MTASGSRAAWRPAGPVAGAYGQCREDLALIVGPTGGGKTTESARRILRAAQWQYPSPIDGIRKCRVAIICTTYRRLWDQVTNSYFKEIDREWGVKGPRGGSGFTGAKGDPWDHRFTITCPDGGKAYVEVMGRAVGEADLEDFFRGLEVTAFWIPELDTHDTVDILAGCQNRVGRYPEPDDRPELPPGTPAAYAGVWADSNAPVIGSWFHNRFYIKRESGDRVFIQPSGLSPNAENLENLRKINPEYYKALAGRMKEKWAIRRFVENKPGFTRHGEPVHEHFDAERMVVHAPIDPEPGLELVIGADCGSTLMPAAVFLQRPGMQVRAMAEVSPGAGGQDLVEFAAEVKRIRETRFAGVKRAVLVVDPAAASRSVMNRQLSLAQILSQYTGIEVLLAPTNDPKARRTGVDQVLKRAGLPGEPGFLASTDCPGLIEALAGGYRFKRTGDKVSETPDKQNRHSHIADALQYGVLGMEGLGLGGGFIHEDGGRGHSEEHRPILQE
jgi:hypothetical protein